MVGSKRNVWPRSVRRTEHAVPARQPEERSQELLSQQQAVGNRAVVTGLQRSAGPSNVIRREATVVKPKGKRNEDFDNTQYRLTGKPPARKIEVVVRNTRDDGTPYYEATGEVTGWQKKLPIIRRYDKPVDLGNWAPRVTHINGMAVTPQSGMTSAETLLDSVQGKIAAAGDDVAVDPDAIDVLYTYSTIRGNIVGDLWDCLKGKARGQRRRHEEARTADARRGSGKASHPRLGAQSWNDQDGQRGALCLQDPLGSVHAGADREAGQGPPAGGASAREELESTGLIDGAMALDMALQQVAEQKAKQRAKTDMDKYIQLVYGGNAVSYPSSVIPVTLFVGSKDPISFGVGTYTKSGAKWASGNKRSAMRKLPGGAHGYTPNYAKPIGREIGEDILQGYARDRSR